MDRDYSAVDRALIRLQNALSAVTAPPRQGPPQAARPNPAGPAEVPAEVELTAAERRHAAGLMRVNHAGEVAAQALYQGHALVARSPEIREHMLGAAAEERSHLAWCEERLQELGEGPSKLDPLWYAGSFAIGAIAGLAGDRWSLGFVEETEKQVAAHLSGHLDQLPQGDARSRVIVEAMRSDEERHGREAVEAGAHPLPGPVRSLMRGVARIMTRSAYWI